MPITDTAAASAKPAPKAKTQTPSLGIDFNEEIVKMMNRLSIYSGYNLKPNEKSMYVPEEKWFEYNAGQKYVMFEVHFLGGVPSDPAELGGDITVECSPNRKVIIVRYAMPDSHPWRSETQWGNIDATYGNPNHANTTSRRAALQEEEERTNGNRVLVQIIPSKDDVTLTGHIDLDMVLVANTKNAVIQARNQRHPLLRIQAQIAEAPLSVGRSPGAPRMIN